MATFPCRWELGLTVSLGPRPGLASARGVVNGGRDEALIQFNAREGVFVALSASPRVTGSWRADVAVTAYAGRDGYLLVHQDRCSVTRADAGGQPLEEWELAPSSCPSSQSSLGRVELLVGGDVVAIDDEGVVVTLIDGLGEVETLGASSLPDGRTIALTAASGALSAWRSGGPRGVPIAARGTAVVLDRVRGAAVLVMEGDGAGAQLARLTFDGPLEAEVLATLPDRPSGPVVSNETEALVPLEDGRLAYLPLALERLETVGPVEGARQTQVVLRPGGSAGGLLHEDESELRFTGLVCNR